MYYGSTHNMGDAAKEYKLMPDHDILEYRPGKYLSASGVLFLWCTSPRMDFAFQCLENWELHYRGIAFVWIKTRKLAPLVPIGAQGVRPSIVKPLTEFVIAASRIAKGRPMPLGSESVAQTVFAPKGKHSEKPEEIQNRIELLYPGARKLELFARRHRPGWTCRGDEL